MSNIRDTVLTSMKAAGLGGYEDRAGPVITALQAREDEIVSNLVNFAVDQGLPSEVAQRAIAECGLYVEDGTTAAEDPRIAMMESAITEMQATLRTIRGQ